MMTLRASNDRMPPARGQVVRRPRATDALGGALRDAFGASPSLPSDMEAALRRLD